MNCSLCSFSFGGDCSPESYLQQMKDHMLSDHRFAQWDAFKRTIIPATRKTEIILKYDTMSTAFEILDLDAAWYPSKPVYPFEDHSQIVEPIAKNPLSSDNLIDLEGLLILYKPLGIVICKQCNIGIHGNFGEVQNHLLVLHNSSINEGSQLEFEQFLENYYRSPETIEIFASTASKFNPIPFIKCFEGISCSLCNYYTKYTSLRYEMARHVREYHRFVRMESFVHTIYKVLIQSIYSTSSVFRVYPESEIGYSPLEIFHVDNYKNITTCYTNLNDSLDTLPTENFIASFASQITRESDFFQKSLDSCKVDF